MLDDCSEYELVDAVVMWVDDNDPVFQQEYAKYKGQIEKKRLDGEGRGRHRNNDELIYCLRCIYYNMSWINRIYIVTNGQVPPFINPAFWGDKLHLITHSDILPDDALPTFNSFAIDSALHNIPDLSETFIRFSDDFLVINPISMETMLGDKGLGRQFFGAYVPYSAESQVTDAKKPYLRILSRNREMIERKLDIICDRNFLHVPQVRKRQLSDNFCFLFNEEIQNTRYNRFRAINDISMLYSYPFYVLHRFYLKFYLKNQFDHADIQYKHWSLARHVPVGSHSVDWRSKLNRAFEDSILFLNINDHFGEDANPADVAWFKARLDELINSPAPWELIVNEN